MNRKQIEQLEEWTQKKYNKTVFDSDIDDWSIDSSLFDSKIIGNNHLAFIIHDHQGEIFGYYLNTTVHDQYEERIRTDKETFTFNLESNGRLGKAMKFEIEDEYGGGYFLFDKTSEYLINLGSLYLCKEENKDECYYEPQNDEFNFNYHSIPNALCGKNSGGFSSYVQMFSLRRLLVLNFI